MRRWTTPTQKFIIHDVDLTDSNVYLTILQNNQTQTFTNPIVTYSEGNSILEFDFSQLQTSSFVVGSASAQINWVTPNNKRFATDIKTIRITKNILERELHYGE